ncbi:aspartic peptidase domain-containing protein [Xylaria nigripes]|nr:aspartic peptidase domain-containing protein [Xylaria nigripes]
MRSSTSKSLFTLGAIATSALAQKVIPLSFSRSGPGHKSLNKRAGTFSEELSNDINAGGYYAEVSLGTPPQPVTLILDTGSSDVWVLDSRADLCHSRLMQMYFGSCFDTYDPRNSSTVTLAVQNGFSIQYLDDSGASGDYIKDTFQIGGASIKQLQVGLAESSTINSGLLGIGFDTNVAARKIYRNIVDLLVDQDLIQTQAYSLYLNDLEAETGTILFGGIDTKKYIGKLQSVDILKDPSSHIFSSFTVSLQSLKIDSGSDSDATEYLQDEILVVLDSGTTMTYLPPAVTSKIYDQLGAVDDSQNTGATLVDCDILNSMKNTTFDFQFGEKDGPVIRVPIHEMVIDNIKPLVQLGLQLPELPFTNVCSFGIQSLTSNTYLLGDTFLRSAYVVYDLSNKKIALAQANEEATEESNVVEITPSGIPLLNGVTAQENTKPNSNIDSSSNTGPSQSSNSAGPKSPTIDNPAVRVMPALQWEAAAVAFVTAFCTLTGATLLVF